MFTLRTHSLARGMTVLALCAGIAALAQLPGRAADGPFQIEKTAGGGLRVTYGGKPVAEYVVNQSNKPYLAPVFGPTGAQMTRDYPMKKVEGEQQDHPHHRGIFFGHEDIAGFDTWIEQATLDEADAKKPGTGKARQPKLGAVKHREYRELKADNRQAVIVAASDVVNAGGAKLLEVEQRITFRAGAGTRTIDLDLDYYASEGPVSFGDKKDAGLSIRVPTSMAVDKKLGGKIVNSEGITDAQAWAKRAKWCDYHGPVGGEILGVAILNHPSSFRFPTFWHVRTYGLFTANPFGAKSLDKTAADCAFTLQKGEHVRLRHRLIFHQGDERAAKIAEAFEAYAKEVK